MLVVPFCFVFRVLLGSLIPEAQGHCRNLRFKSAPIHGHRLNNHVIRTIGVMNEDFCEMQCYLEPNCVSYNFKNNGEHKCDLNNATYEHDNEHSGDLAKDENYVYRGAENACAKKPCQNNATCQAGFTDRDYQCLCIPGFTGHDCENDIDECTNGTHKCDVNGALCNNTPGSYNCTCKDGFVGDGINCTDIDECANAIPPDCDVNAVCNNTQGSYVCTCKEGFYKDGQNCTRFVAGECASPMGMENGNISDSALKASSKWSAATGPSKGRVDHPTTYIAEKSNKEQWIQVDFGKVAKVTKIGTQGCYNQHHCNEEWVSKYTVSYSFNGEYFENQLQNSSDVPREYEANKDSANLVVNTLDEPIVARYVRIHPSAWKGRISMRLELYGCYSGFPTSKPPACMASLGLENNDIPDSAITASSEDNYKESRGRLYQQESWIADVKGTEQWFQVDFVNRTKVTGVAIQGCAYRSWQWWVTKFKLAYSYDGEFFSDYREDGHNTKEFAGNTDHFLVVSHLLKNPINVTRYIRIYPVAWNNGISLRADFYGCKSEMEIPQTVCASPLGMENGRIPNSAIVASSRYRHSYGPERGRLNNQGGWISDDDWKDNQFLHIDLENVTKVTRIATQGSFDKNWWTKNYTLDYSQDGVTFISHNNGQVLQGNTDNVRTAGHILDPPIIARFIKINVKTYQERPSLRVELYGCSDGFPTPKPPVCLEAFGMQNKQIPDSAITVSSYLSSRTEAKNGRLHFLRTSDRAGGWAAGRDDNNQFFQVHFGDWRKVARVAIQGREDRNQWVKSFSLSYGYDSVSFQDYKEEGLKKVFPGNNDQYTPVSNDLKYPIITPYIRIHPESWHGRIAMRTEFYGCIEECQDALGMENRTITDAQITASSERNAVHAASNARLNFQEIPNKAAGAWVANSRDANPWLQVDLGARNTKVTRVATQGRNSALTDIPQWVTKYKLQYDDNGEAFHYYKEMRQATVKEFDGNTDEDTVVYHALNPPITARYIRFQPVANHGHVSMRVELYGCVQGFDATFTSLGASGKDGPKSLGGNYTGQDHDGQVTLSDGIQRWTVPYTGQYRIEAVGAAGGYDNYQNSSQYRGRGARMVGTFNLSQGEIIQILVGQEGGIRHNNWSSGVGGAGGGGGGTFVVRGSNTSLIVAGGGGGLRAVTLRHEGCDASTNLSGNHGYKSWPGGSNGNGAETRDNKPSGGGGGFYSSGRNGTAEQDGEGGKGFLQGGTGGQSWDGHVNGGFGGGGGGGRGGGGGGGYSGGSSGNNKNDSCGGGGGSYNVGKNQQSDCCYNTAGHGKVIITLL